MNRANQKQQGFTIIELLIATVVLAIIVLMATVIITSIGNLYYKGIAQSRIQDNVRSLTDELSQKLKYGGNITAGTGFLPVTGPVVGLLGATQQGFCVGDTRYFFVPGIQVGAQYGGQTLYHALWRDHNPDAPNCDTTIGNGHTIDLSDSNLESNDAANEGTELVGPRSRIVKFDISQDPSTLVYSIGVMIAYGDDDQLCSPNIPSSCTNTTPMSSLGSPSYIADYTDAQLTCKQQSGSQFCSVAELSTNVLPLLN